MLCDGWTPPSRAHIRGGGNPHALLVVDMPARAGTQPVARRASRRGCGLGGRTTLPPRHRHPPASQASSSPANRLLPRDVAPEKSRPPHTLIYSPALAFSRLGPSSPSAAAQTARAVRPFHRRTGRDRVRRRSGSQPAHITTAARDSVRCPRHVRFLQFNPRLLCHLLFSSFFRHPLQHGWADSERSSQSTFSFPFLLIHSYRNRSIHSYREFSISHLISFSNQRYIMPIILHNKNLKIINLISILNFVFTVVFCNE
jgi:hypothetical protein